MKAACAFFRSAKALNALTPREPRAGTARGTPALGREVASTLLSALANLVAEALDELSPALADAEASPAAAAELADEDEPPLELDEPEEAAAPSPTATAADEPVEDELDAPSPEDEEAPLEPLDAAAPPPPHSSSQSSEGAATTATEDDVPELEEALEPLGSIVSLPSDAADEPPEPLEAAAPPSATTATDELVVELELVEAAYAPVALSISAKTVYANIFIIFLYLLFALAFRPNSPFLLIDCALS